MGKIENYPNAYKEVYEILKTVPKEDCDKIPSRFMQMIQKNMNKEYEFKLDQSSDFGEQELMFETRTILAYIFLNYWATEKQKETINAKFKKDIQEEEERRRKIYDVDVFKNKKQQQNENSNEQLEMTVYKKENFVMKIFNRLKRIFSKNKNKN